MLRQGCAYHFLFVLHFILCLFVCLLTGLDAAITPKLCFNVLFLCVYTFYGFFCVYIFALILYFLETVALYVCISHISISHFLIVIYLSIHIFIYTAFEVNCV